ncbi:hypothetical protein HAX54_023523 [Datura stramonium]|uniref:Uncharacterized protein n=1 Tax=Datura stramonium TaxID=4076 RepID=A0ABS8UYM1_DATST|nr:hypothetical protein [Datura stramonium]
MASVMAKGLCVKEEWDREETKQRRAIAGSPEMMEQRQRVAERGRERERKGAEIVSRGEGNDEESCFHRPEAVARRTVATMASRSSAKKKKVRIESSLWFRAWDSDKYGRINIGR